MKKPNKPNIAKWLDGFILAGKGILLAMRDWRFWVGFVIAFGFFGTLMNLLSNGFTKFQMMGIAGFGGAMKILGEAFWGIFGVGQVFWDWLAVFLIAILQGVLIGLIALLWNKKKSGQGSNSANVEKAGIISGLIALGAGCPTCGTTLLTPLFTAILSAGGAASSAAISGVVSIIVTILAILLAILALRRIGEETYVIITNEKYMKKMEEKKSHEKSA